MEIDFDKYFTKGMNCAETTLSMANDVYGLGLTGNELKMIGGFGGGMCSRRTCGALSAGVAALSRIYLKTTAHGTPGFMEIVKEYVDSFEAEAGSTQCIELIPKYLKMPPQPAEGETATPSADKPGEKLPHCVVELNAELLARCIANHPQNVLE